MDNVKILLECSFDEENGAYRFRSSEGASANEIIFCIAGLFRCFDRDGIAKKEDCLNLLQKYLNDPQYEELREVN